MFRFLKVSLVLILSVLTVVVLQAARARRNSALMPRLPVHGQVAAFALTERDGREITAADLEGRVWIADFIFTRCASTCPRMTTEMARLASDLAGRPEIRFVSFTVDPEHDTPAVLEQYAAANGAGERWLFLTGSRAVIYRLARTSFHLGVEEVGEVEEEAGVPQAAPNGEQLPVQEDGAGAGEPFIHSTRFVLVDREGRIRGYYDAMDPERNRALRVDVEAILRETQPPA